MPVENAAAPVPSVETTPARKFGIYDSMILIAGIALLLTYGQHNFSSLLEQFMGLCKTIAVYFV